MNASRLTDTLSFAEIKVNEKSKLKILFFVFTFSNSPLISVKISFDFKERIVLKLYNNKEDYIKLLYPFDFDEIVSDNSVLESLNISSNDVRLVYAWLSKNISWKKIGKNNELTVVDESTLKILPDIKEYIYLLNSGNPEVEDGSVLARISIMLAKNNDLNIKTSGLDWLSGFSTVTNREISWNRCISQKSSSIIDLLPWKHYRDLNLRSDLRSIKENIVDIWNYTLSFVIQEYGLEDASSVIIQHYEKELKKEKTVLSSLDVISLLYKVEQLQLSMHQKNTSSFELLSLFFDLLNIVYFEQPFFVAFNKLERYFYGKNALNLFRQNNGLLYGTYNKDWAGEEDRLILIKILNSLPRNITSFDLENLVYEKLDTLQHQISFTSSPSPVLIEPEPYWDDSAIDFNNNNSIIEVPLSVVIDKISEFKMESLNKGHIRQRYKKLFNKECLSDYLDIEEVDILILSYKK